MNLHPGPIRLTLRQGGCYHFATQLGSTGHHRVTRNELRACRNPYTMGLSDTGRHELKRPLPNGQFMLGLEPKGQY